MQKGAEYGRIAPKGNGDICGRYAWAQGPVSTENEVGRQQYYPRDFNIFTLSGSIDGLRDVDGSVASAQNVTVHDFHLNVGKKEALALLAKANVTIFNGTVEGSLIYGGGYYESAPGSVTYVEGSRPTAPTNPSPINFSTVSNKLVAMSNELKAYPTVAAQKDTSTVSLVGTDPELNVFTLAPSQLTGTYSYTCSVPPGSSVIINVSGTAPVIQYAGFSGFPAENRILWHFPDATSLKLDGVGFPGSILAPRAAANLTNGSIAGTVVVKSAYANVELYSAPFQMPACAGCLCLDSRWSCSKDTTVDDKGDSSATASVGLILPEAGFLEIQGEVYHADSQDLIGPTHRIWYSFIPAKARPKNKPLAVIFNGGPGSATSALLFAFNTAPMTLDPAVAGSSRIKANPHSWTEFANLLYVDAPGTGFSYPVTDTGLGQPEIGNVMEYDAGVFLRVVLGFLLRHPALHKGRILLVGESYGGVRASLMLDRVCVE